MRPCGPVRSPRRSRRAVAKMIYPTESNITLTHDGQVKVGSHVIGQWSKDEAYEGGFHFRPVYTRGKCSYSAYIHGKGSAVASKKNELYKEIAALCKSGITIS